MQYIFNINLYCSVNVHISFPILTIHLTIQLTEFWISCQKDNRTCLHENVTLKVSTGNPQGCVRSPQLLTLLTHDCDAIFSTNHIIRFTNEITVMGVISNNDETNKEKRTTVSAQV